MASLISHPAVPIGLALAAGPERVPWPLLAAGIVGSCLPDADVIAFKFGIPYEHMLGHRGFSHSILFAVLFAAAATLYWRRMGPDAWTVFGFVFLSTLSHGMLDALTDGGHGVGFFAPFSDERYFFPWQPIAVSPI